MSNEDLIRKLMDDQMTGRITRRQMVRRLTMMGLSMPVISAIVAACGGSSSSNTPTTSASTTAATSASTTGGNSTPTTAASTSSSSSPSATTATSPSAAATTASTSLNFKGQTLVVTSYGGTWQQFMESDHIPDFEKQTGAKVQLAIGLAKDWFAKIRAAGKDNPPFDVVVMNETYCAQLRQEGNFVSLPTDKVPNLQYVNPKLTMDNNVGVLGLIGPFGIAYRSDKVSDPPKSWLDLAKYGDKTGIYIIGNSAEPQQILLMAKILTGDYHNWQAGFKWIKDNLSKAKQVDFSGTLQTDLQQGEVNVAFIDSPDWALLKAKGLPVEFVIPKEGIGGMFEQNMNVTAGSKVKDLGYAFINYWLSEPVQKKWAEKFYWTPANTKVQISADAAKLIPVTSQNLDTVPRWDYLWLNSGPRDEMTNLWNREMSGA